MSTGEPPASIVQNVLRDAAPGKCGLRSPAAKARYRDVDDVAADC